MQLGVLVDLAVDAHQQTGGLQIGEMLLEINRGLAFWGVVFALSRSLVHGVTLWFRKPSAYTGRVHDGQSATADCRRLGCHRDLLHDLTEPPCCSITRSAPSPLCSTRRASQSSAPASG